MSTSSHLDRKELKKPDAFLESSKSLVSIITENMKTVAALLLVVAAFGVGAAFYSSSKSKKADQANSAFYAVQKEFQQAVEKAPKGSADLEKTLSPQIEKLQKLAKDYQGTQAAYQAWTLLGDFYFGRNAPGKAAEQYKLAADSAPSKMTKSMSQYSLAYSYENAKKYDQAIDELRRVLSSGEKSLKVDATTALARNFELKGDKAKAIEQYDQLIKEFPNSPTAKTAEARKQALR